MVNLLRRLRMKHAVCLPEVLARQLFVRSDVAVRGAERTHRGSVQSRTKDEQTTDVGPGGDRAARAGAGSGTAARRRGSAAAGQVPAGSGWHHRPWRAALRRSGSQRLPPRLARCVGRDLRRVLVPDVGRVRSGGALSAGPRLHPRVPARVGLRSFPSPASVG